MPDDAETADGDWLSTLGDQTTTVDFPVFGFHTVAPDWGFTDRVLHDHLLYFVIDGSCLGHIEDTDFSLEKGSLLWVQPRMRHTFTLGTTTPRLTLYYTRFRLSRPDGLPEPTRDPAWRRDDAWDQLELMDQLHDELRSMLPHRDVRLRSLLTAICAGELRHQQTATPTTGVLSRAQRRAVETYVRDHLAEWPSPPVLADQIHLSHDYFSRLFSRTFGMPPRTWLVRERVRHGAILLTETLQSVAQIAASLGYTDVSTFSHQFKQAYGIGPRSYRRSHR